MAFLTDLGDLSNCFSAYPKPGTYRLSGNLTLPDENTTAIKITTNHVTIDLAGFSILGPVVCSGVPLTCTPAEGIGYGVESYAGGGVFYNNITVLNGNILGMGESGIMVGAESRIENVVVKSCGHYGISAGEGSRISGSTALKNYYVGISALYGSIFTGNIAIGNGEHGILAWGGSMVIGNTARNNGMYGIGCFADDVGYANNVSNGNGLAAIWRGLPMGGNVCDGAPCP